MVSAEHGVSFGSKVRALLKRSIYAHPYDVRNVRNDDDDDVAYVAYVAYVAS